MNDKRTAKRIHLDHPVALRIEDDSIEGRLVNLSSTGALFAFEGESRASIDPSVLGIDASFRIRPKGKPVREYTGELVRFYVREEASFLALRFWNKYREIQD